MTYPSQYQYAEQGHITRTDGREWEAVRAPLPKEFDKHHLNGGPRYGSAFIRAGSDRTMTGLIDLDDHGGEVGWDKVVELADMLMLNLSVMGVTAIPFRSGGQQGINLWVLFDEPTQAAAVRKLLTDALTYVGLTSGAAGVVAGEAEVFPKQNSVGDQDIGNCAALPRFALDPLTLKDMAFERVVWKTNKPLVDIEVEEVEEAIEEVLSPEMIAELLAHIPNDQPRGEGSETGLHYDDWLKVMMASKAAGADIDVVRAWSKQSNRYNAREFTNKWKSARRQTGPNAVGAGTLKWYATHLGGWSGVVADVSLFDVYTPGVHDRPEYERVRSKGRYKNYIVANVEQLITCLSNDPAFPWRIAFDEFCQDVMIHNIAEGRVERFMDHHYTMLRAWFDRDRWEPVSSLLIREVVNKVAYDQVTNIARTWLLSQAWDGVDRFPQLAKALGIEYSDYVREVFNYQWSAHAARAIDPGHKCDVTIVIVSQIQGIGKTASIQAFAPIIAGINTYRDTDIHRLLDESSSARSLRGCLVANMDELSGFSKREAASIKSALSRTHESFVPKFKEKREEFGRSCLLYGTSNELKIFDDDTGNRRFYVLETGVNIDVKWVRDNHVQLWAQGAEIFKTDGVQWAKAAELAVEVIKKYQVEEDPWLDLIGDYLNTLFIDRITTNELLGNALHIPEERRTKRESIRLGKIMRQLGWKYTVVTTAGKNTKMWRNENEVSLW